MKNFNTRTRQKLILRLQRLRCWMKLTNLVSLHRKCFGWWETQETEDILPFHWQHSHHIECLTRVSCHTTQSRVVHIQHHIPCQVESRKTTKIDWIHHHFVYQYQADYSNVFEGEKTKTKVPICSMLHYWISWIRKIFYCAILAIINLIRWIEIKEFFSHSLQHRFPLIFFFPTHSSSVTLPLVLKTTTAS